VSTPPWRNVGIPDSIGANGPAVLFSRYGESQSIGRLRHRSARLHHDGKTIDETERNTREAIQGRLETLRGYGEPGPEPTSVAKEIEVSPAA